MKTVVQCIINCRDFNLVGEGNYTTIGLSEIPLANIFFNVFVAASLNSSDLVVFPVMYFPQINDTGIFGQVINE